MIERTKRHKKGSISEEDVSTVLRRYTATTVLALLQEVAQVSEVKIDWNALVKRSTTGISSAREYQMLWRHLAYRDSLLERLDDGTEPQGDDSDLEYELEAFPAVSSEASTEAAACVKVLVASVAPNDSSLTNGTVVEAPLTINIPNGQSSRFPSESSQLAIQGTNITVPVSVQKQQLPTVTSSEVPDANGSASGSLPPRRKRKPWSAAEDLELIAAVQKCGEGNWANILKGDFKGDRTASQLSQRWAIIRKRKGNLNVGSGSQLSEAQLAARRAVSFALDMPMGANLTTACSTSTGGTHSSTVPSNSSQPTVGEAPSVGGNVSQVQQQSQQNSIPTTAAQAGMAGSSLKSRVTSKKTSTKTALGPDALVKAAAVAAGARIATPSDAASLMKAAQSKNAVHIKPGGGSLIKPPGASCATSLPGHPNVHYIRTGLATTPLSSYPAASSNASWNSGTQVQGHSAKPVVQTTQLNPISTATASTTSSETTNAATSNSGMEVKEQVQEDQVAVLDNERQDPMQEDQPVVPGMKVEEQVQEDQVAVLDNERKDQPVVPGMEVKEQVQEDQVAVSDNERRDQPVVPGMEVKEQVQEDQVAVLANERKDLMQEDEPVIPGLEVKEQVQEDQVAVLDNERKDPMQEDQPVVPGMEVKEQVQEDQVAVLDNERQDLMQEDQPVVPENEPKEQPQEDLASASADAVKECSAEDQTTISGGNAPDEQAQENQTAPPTSSANLNSEMDVVENPNPSSANLDSEMDFVENPNHWVQTVEISHQIAEGNEICDSEIANGKQDASSMMIDGNGETVELLSEPTAGTS